MNMRKDDIEHVVRRLPPAVRAALKGEPRDPLRAVAGGFVRAVIAGERPSDVDLFVASQEDVGALIDTLTGGALVSYRTDFAESFWLGRTMVQVIHAWTFDKVSALVDSFDFTVCQAAVFYDGKSWRGWCSERFYSDLAAHRLWYARADDDRPDIEVGGTLARLLKYTARGYSAPPETVAAVVADVAKISLVGPSREKLTELLRGIDPRPDIAVATE